MEVRTRFAPSPSGFLHVGGARTALFNYLYAKSQGGKFILRIEDTDQDRSTEASFKTILESLKWLGLEWDEGPGVEGPYGPYIQSQRIPLYKEYTNRLISEKKAYRCFCTHDELDAKKKQSEAMGIPNIYDGKCSGLTDKEIEDHISKNTPFSVRFKTPAFNLVVEDMIQGKVKFETKLIGDFIIVKSDGFPSYNYAVVIDDYLMKISHVIRGVGHLSNTPRQIMIYQALGFDLPKFAHVSEIVGTDGKKLSKRAGATSILAFRDLGYTHDSFANYMALLGWTPEDGREYLPAELNQIFDVARCSKSPSTFDVFKKVSEEEKEKTDFNSLTTDALSEFLNPKSKLNWISNKYIRDLPLDRIANELLPFVKSYPGIPQNILDHKNETFLALVQSIRPYLDRLSQAPPYIAEFFLENLSFENQEAIDLVKNGPKAVIAFYQLLKSSEPKNGDDYKNLLSKAGEISGEKGKNLFMPIRGATTGKTHGLELPILFPLLGVSKIMHRMESLCKQSGLDLSQAG
jgi:glutamyl/glutaminyl-tRNA synthetase